MKKKPFISQTLLPALCLCVLLAACNSGSSYENPTNPGQNSQNKSEDGHQPVPATVEKLLFDGKFTGNANEQTFRLNLTNEDGIVKGAMAEGGKSYTLLGTVAGETLTGKINLGAEIPFEAHYYGDNLVMQLDENTINGFKAAGILGALLTGDDGDVAVQVLLAQSKIIFMPG